MSDYYVKVHANGRNKSQHCWAQQCWVLLVNNVGSVCISLKEWQADRSVVGDSRSSRRIRIVKILHNRAANRSMRKSVKVWQTSTIIKERSDPTWPRLFRNRGRPTESIKAHANGPNIVGQQLPTLLGVVGQQCCVCLHGTTTMLALVGTCWVQFETGQTFRPMQTDATLLADNTQQFWELLALVASVCMGLKTARTKLIRVPAEWCQHSPLLRQDENIAKLKSQI